MTVSLSASIFRSSSSACAVLIWVALNAQPFAPHDTLLANNVFQVEFSTDCRSMVWCEQIPIPGKATIWYADVDLTTGFPDLDNRQLIDTIQGQGWPYWGHDQESRFFLYMDQYGVVKITRRSGFNTLTEEVIAAPGIHPERALLNVSADSTLAHFWVNYVVRSGTLGVRDSLFVFRSDVPSNVLFVDAALPSAGGSAYEITFPRWLANSEVLAYPFRPGPLPVFDMRFWYGSTQTSRQVTDDIAQSLQNSHIDDLPFTLPYLPGDTFLFSSRSASLLSILERDVNGMFQYTNSFPTTTTIEPFTLTSFEPFTINGDKTYGAYQVYEGGGIPGNDTGEVWLQGISSDPLLVKLNTFVGVAVDPEYVIGTDSVWIFYYGRPVGQPTFDLHRCSTPLSIALPTDVPSTVSPHSGIAICPNPVSDVLHVRTEGSTVRSIVLRDAQGQLVRSTTKAELGLGSLPPGLYVVAVRTDDGSSTQLIIKQ